MTITEELHKPGNEPCDWFAWLKTKDGVHVKVQIGYQATREQAEAIIARLRD